MIRAIMILFNESDLTFEIALTPALSHGYMGEGVGKRQPLFVQC
jgi:hypothetical protein